MTAMATAKMGVFTLWWQRHIEMVENFPLPLRCERTLTHPHKFVWAIFRWFKFSLKPPYSIAHDKLQLAIWDTFGLLGLNLDTRDLETYPRTYSGRLSNMSLFGNSTAVWVLFRKWMVSENQSFLVTSLSV